MTAINEDVRKTCALVVEDDPNIVDLIRSNLAVRGFDTVVSVDGEVGPDQVHDVGVVLHHQGAGLADVLVYRRHRPASPSTGR